MTGKIFYLPVRQRERTPADEFRLDSATEWLLCEIKEPPSVQGLRALAKKELERPRDSLHGEWAKHFLNETEAYVVNELKDALRTLRSAAAEAWDRLDDALADTGRDRGKGEHLMNEETAKTQRGRRQKVTRKGAVRAREGDLGIIPGSMGAKSFIVRGKGNPDSFHSCSHGAGRAMSRTEAKRRFTLEDHAVATAGVECRKDADVIDETPGAYKSIDDVMRAQEDLVEIVATLKQVLCVKG